MPVQPGILRHTMHANDPKRPVSIRLVTAFGISAAFIGGCAFLYMVKLMHDMTEHMSTMSSNVAVMSKDMHAMRLDMAGLSADVSKMTVSAEPLPAMAEDVHGMRASMERMTGVVTRGSKQIEKLNPMGVMEQMLPPGGGGR